VEIDLMPDERPMPNAALRTLLEAIQDVMGENGTKAVLNTGGLQRYVGNFPSNNLDRDVTFSDYGKIEQAVEDTLGPRGARATMLRIGRVTFQTTLKEQPAILGNLGALVLKVLPTASAMKLVLGQVSSAANKTVNQPAHIEEDDEAFYFVVEECPCHWRGAKAKPVCHVTVGVLSEAMSFASGGKRIRVEEIECIAAGGLVCKYRIEKRPLE
jgi:predicted hydrocarbon binding protein